MQNQPSGIRDNKCQLGVGRAHTIYYIERIGRTIGRETTDTNGW